MEEKKCKPYKAKSYELGLIAYLSGDVNNAEQLANYLTSKGLKISPRTAVAWMRTADENGNDWETRRALLWDKLNRKEEDMATLNIAKLRNECSDVLEGVIEDLKDAALTFKTKEGAINSLSVIISIMHKLGSGAKWSNPIYVIQEYTNILKSIPEVNRVITRNQTKIDRRIDAMFSDNETRAIDVTPDDQNS
ncbi:hypothetical protein LEP1GSC126_3368 [Leptospira kirschneri str. 200801774]|uniref:hypothetical protein n=1 Tax=Leptospira kirschneri TaxID=29507 RepID=UPI0002BF3B61|nr:hypothetical protein [Leptospira kirschneri]EMO80198.1 hypothetical protein LEP1GSC126_3368 [Leptospira kirschneri str. 200801774]